MPDVSKHTMTDNIFRDSRTVMNFGEGDWQISRLSKSSDVIEEFGAYNALLENDLITVSSSPFWITVCYINIGRTTVYKEMWQKIYYKCPIFSYHSSHSKILPKASKSFPHTYFLHLCILNHFKIYTIPLEIRQCPTLVLHHGLDMPASYHLATIG